MFAKLTERELKDDIRVFYFCLECYRGFPHANFLCIDSKESSRCKHKKYDYKGNDH